MVVISILCSGHRASVPLPRSPLCTLSLPSSSFNFYFSSASFPLFPQFSVAVFPHLFLPSAFVFLILLLHSSPLTVFFSSNPPPPRPFLFLYHLLLFSFAIVHLISVFYCFHYHLSIAFLSPLCASKFFVPLPSLFYLFLFQVLIFCLFLSTVSLDFIRKYFH